MSIDGIVTLYYACAVTHRNSVVMIDDGWAYAGKRRIVAGTGYVKIFGWISLGDPLFSETLEVDLDRGGDLPGEMLLNTKL